MESLDEDAVDESVNEAHRYNSEQDIPVMSGAFAEAYPVQRNDGSIDSSL